MSHIRSGNIPAMIGKRQKEGQETQVSLVASDQISTFSKALNGSPHTQAEMLSHSVPDGKGSLNFASTLKLLLLTAL